MRAAVALVLGALLCACGTTPDYRPVSASLASFGLTAEDSADGSRLGRPGGPRVTEQDVLDALRERGQTGGRPRLALIEVRNDGAEHVAASVSADDLAAFERGCPGSVYLAQSVPGFLLPRELGWVSLRHSAARAGADQMLLVTRAAERYEYANGWSTLYLTLIGYLFVPGETIEVHAAAEGALVDVKTGRIVGVLAVTQRDDRSVLPIGGTTRPMRDLVREVDGSVMMQLGEQVAKLR